MVSGFRGNLKTSPSAQSAIEMKNSPRAINDADLLIVKFLIPHSSFS